MKKLLLTLLFIPVIGLAQEKTSTTDEEYKYLTEGYKIQQETGSDLKSGYSLQVIQEDKLKDFTITYALFNESAINKAKAISIVVTKGKEKKDKAFYFCLPINNTDLYYKFFQATEAMGISMKTTFDKSMFLMLSKSLDKAVNRK